MSKDRFRRAALVCGAGPEKHHGVLAYRGLELPCALGRNGITQAKREGDNATPAGNLPFRRMLYRADRLAELCVPLAMNALTENDGWCDAPGDARYNRPVTHPYPASAERLWRDDHLYDLIVVLGHNDDPPVPGLGSAIFLHVARPDYGPTEGCVALALADLLRLLERADAPDALEVELPL